MPQPSDRRAPDPWRTHKQSLTLLQIFDCDERKRDGSPIEAEEKNLRGGDSAFGLPFQEIDIPVGSSPLHLKACFRFPNSGGDRRKASFDAAEARARQVGPSAGETMENPSAA